MKNLSYCAILFGINISYAQPSDEWITRGFPLGGIDRDSYLYWPTKPTDLRPLQMAKVGKRADAFALCLSQIDKSKGDDRLFYSVQATTLGFSLGKSHLVYGKVRKLVVPEIPQALFHDLHVKKEDWLLLAYIGAVCDQMPIAQPEWKKLRASAHELNYASRFALTAEFSRVEHLFLQGTMAGLMMELSKSRRSLTLATELIPESSMAWLVLARAHFIAPSKDKVPLEQLMKSGVGYISKARQLDPANPRAMYLDGVIKVASGKYALGSELLEKFLKTGGGTAGEIQSARNSIRFAASKRSRSPG